MPHWPRHTHDWNESEKMNAVKGLFRLIIFCGLLFLAGYAVFAFSETENAQSLKIWWNANIGPGPTVIAISGVLYFFPTIVAVYRNSSVVSVFIINLAFGWSIIGWIIAFMGAMA